MYSVGLTAIGPTELTSQRVAVGRRTHPQFGAGAGAGVAAGARLVLDDEWLLELLRELLVHGGAGHRSAGEQRHGGGNQGLKNHEGSSSRPDAGPSCSLAAAISRLPGALQRADRCERLDPGRLCKRASAPARQPKGAGMNGAERIFEQGFDAGATPWSWVSEIITA